MRNANITLQRDVLLLAGSWSAKGIVGLQKQPLTKLILPTFPLVLDGENIADFDSSGAWQLDELIQQLEEKHIKVSLKGFSSEQMKLIKLVQKNKIAGEKLIMPEALNPLARFGKYCYNKLLEFLVWMAFIGEFSIVSLKLFLKPYRIKWTYVAVIIQNMGLRALPIVGFLSFLIGVVLTYQIGLELKLYGANIYIISLLGLAILREFGPLITAIILAGRTSSSYTAQLGLMQSNEEIDALKTMGLSPTEILTFPRILGLVIVMPLLIVWADFFGIVGGMIMSKAVLGIGYYSFLNQFPQDVTLTTFMIGLSKAPVFASIIAAVGCFQGFQVSGSSESIGTQTTKSVVLAIFLIIIADAAFSIVLSWIGI